MMLLTDGDEGENSAGKKKKKKKKKKGRKNSFSGLVSIIKKLFCYTFCQSEYWLVSLQVQLKSEDFCNRL